MLGRADGGARGGQLGLAFDEPHPVPDPLVALQEREELTVVQLLQAAVLDQLQQAVEAHQNGVHGGVHGVRIDGHDGSLNEYAFDFESRCQPGQPAPGTSTAAARI